MAVERSASRMARSNDGWGAVASRLARVEWGLKEPGEISAALCQRAGSSRQSKLRRYVRAPHARHRTPAAAMRVRLGTPGSRRWRASRPITTPSANPSEGRYIQRSAMMLPTLDQQVGGGRQGGEEESDGEAGSFRPRRQARMPSEAAARHTASARRAATSGQPEDSPNIGIWL